MMTKRILTMLLAVMLCVAVFPLSAFAADVVNEPIPTATPAPESTSILTPSPTPSVEPQPLTPQGNMSLVDDIDGEGAGDKQYITVVSRNGNYFYIIIDRAVDGENTVHFLNQVDEADLKALIDEGATEAKEPTATCICTTKCVAGSVNTACAVCKLDVKQCLGVEPVPSPTPDPKPEEKSGGNSGTIIIILLLALAGGGAYYYFKIYKPKSKSNTDLDDYDFGDDDEDDEPESDPDEDEDEFKAEDETDIEDSEG